MTLQVSARFILTLLQCLYFISALSEQCIVIADGETKKPIPFVYAQVQQQQFIGDINGIICIQALDGDSLYLNSFTYSTKFMVYQKHLDTVYLYKQWIELDQITIKAQKAERQLLKDFSKKKLFERSPGELFFRQVWSDCPVGIDSVQIYVKKVMRSDNIFRVLILSKSKKVVEISDPISIPSNIEEEYYNIPTGFWRTFRDTFYVGIEFLEKNVDSDNLGARHYRFTRKGLTTYFNNGVTLGGSRLSERRKKSRLYILKTAKKNCVREGFMYWNCYIGIYYSGDCKLKEVKVE